MKIAFFETKEEDKKFFREALQSFDVEIDFFEEKADEIIKKEAEYEVISTFIYSKIDKTLLNNLPNLKYVQTRSAGYDHIDIVECYKRGIYVSNAKGYAGPAVGEFAFGLLLEAIRKIYTAIQRVKNGNLEYRDLKGMEIEGKTIGILGVGTIGSQIAKIAKGFGANVIGYSRHNKEWIKTTPVLEEVLEKSDFLFIALPLTPQTENLINLENLKTFKGKVIVNPARAEIISREVYEKFDGIIAADVLPDWNLAKKENIIATPHMAYYTFEALRRINQISLDNLLDFLDGKTPRYCLKEECYKNYSCKG